MKNIKVIINVSLCANKNIDHLKVKRYIEKCISFSQYNPYVEKPIEITKVEVMKIIMEDDKDE